MAVGGGDIGDTVQHFLEQIEQLHHLVAAAGHILLHLVDERINTGRHGHIHRRTVGVFGDHAEAIGYLLPFHLHTVLLKDPAHITGILHRSQIAQLVQRGLDFEATSAEAAGTAAGQIMLLDQQCLFAGQCHLHRSGQTGVTGTDHNNIILFHVTPLFKYF